MNAAKQSPIMETDGTLRWYAGDTFTLTLAFTLKDAGGSVITPSQTDTITVKFFDKTMAAIQEFSNTGSATIDLVFTDSISAKFPEGVYSILVKFNSDNVTTLLKSNKVVVE